MSQLPKDIDSWAKKLAEDSINCGESEYGAPAPDALLELLMEIDRLIGIWAPLSTIRPELRAEIQRIAERKNP